MALLNLTQAASMAGISRVTLNKHLRYGKKNGNERVMITTVNAPDGSTRIDSSEILRVYGANVNPKPDVCVNASNPLQEALERENNALREQLAKAEERERWLQGKVDELTNTIRMIEHKPADVVPPVDPDPVKRSWWKRFFSR